jgi:hypothetical protein
MMRVLPIRLANRVVDLVRTGMVEVFALQINPRATQLFAPASRQINRRWPADIVLQIVIQFSQEVRVAQVLLIRLAQFGQWLHKGFGNEYTAIRTKKTLLIRKTAVICRLSYRHPPHLA